MQTLANISRTRRHWTGDWRGGLAIAVLGMALIVPGLTALPPIDRDEARFAEATRQMLASDDWHGYLVPMFDGEPRLNKPPLVYWLQSISVAAFDPTREADTSGHGLPTGNIWAYRLPSVFAAIGAALVTWRLGLCVSAAPVAWWGGALLLASPLILVDARQARADQVLLLATVIAQFALWHIWRSRLGGRTPIAWVAALWLAIGVGMMTKGPVPPAVVAMTSLFLCISRRQWRWLHRLHIGWGLLIVAAIVVPWIWLVGREVGWEMLGRVAAAEVLQRSTSAREGHWGPPGYYVALLPFAFWAGLMGLAAGLQRTITTARFRRISQWFRSARLADGTLFCVAWLVPTWLVFELIATKLPHYVLPAYPALAILCARGLYSTRGWNAVFQHVVGRAAVVGWLLVGELFAVALPLAIAIGLGAMETRGHIVAIVSLAIVAQGCLVATALWLWRWRRPVCAQRWAIATTLTASIAVFMVILPEARSLWISSRIWQSVQRIDPNAERPLAAAGYREDSLVFLARGRIDRLEWWALDQWLDAHPNGLAILAPHPVLEGPPAHTLATVRGLNYSNGEWMTVKLVEPQESASAPSAPATSEGTHPAPSSPQEPAR